MGITVSGLRELAAIGSSMRSERANPWAIWGVGEVGAPKILTIEGTPRLGRLLGPQMFSPSPIVALDVFC